jgi:hypothetical protein
MSLRVLLRSRLSVALSLGTIVAETEAKKRLIGIKDGLMEGDPGGGERECVVFHHATRDVGLAVLKRGSRDVMAWKCKSVILFTSFGFAERRGNGYAYVPECSCPFCCRPLPLAPPSPPIRLLGKSAAWPSSIVSLKARAVWREEALRISFSGLMGSAHR